MSTASTESWRGVPLADVRGSASPWGAPEFPLISPGYNHAVLFHVGRAGPAGPVQRPPSPQRGHDKWDKECVRMPCSSHSLYPVEGEDGSTSLMKRWEIIKSSLQKPISNSQELADVILSYNTKFINQWKFTSLHHLFNEHLEEEESEYFFNVTMPEIARLALSLPQLIQSPIPLLKQHKNRAVSLTQEQISSLLANAFFCTFPRRNTNKKSSEYSSYPYINFNSLYEASHTPSVMEKLKCICHYFRRVCIKVPVGVLTFLRRTVEPAKCPAWPSSDKLIGGTPVHVNSSGTIEDDGLGLIQIDFANKYLGGGVLNHGCVQEEIRFVICPELLVSMLFTEVLRPTEALLMIGCERYSSYTGYGSTFQWAGDYVDTAPFDSSGRRRCAVLAIDALPFAQERHQYRAELITRELNKAWVGVSACTSAQDESRLLHPGVATGNWGCGAFGGTAALKSLLQIMACSEARRPMAYYTFGDVELRNAIISMYNYLSQHNITVGQLYKYILKFAQTNVAKSELYSFICQLHLDENARQDRTVVVSPEKTDPVDSKLDTASSTLNFSPDLFSGDETEPFMETPNDFVDLEKGEGTLRLNPEVWPPHKEDESTFLEKPIHHTTSLFDEMTKFDAANSTLNLNKKPQPPMEATDATLNMEPAALPIVDSEADSGFYAQEDINQVKEMLDTGISENINAEVEKSSAKKMAKKITDYFHKKH